MDYDNGTGSGDPGGEVLKALDYMVLGRIIAPSDLWGNEPLVLFVSARWAIYAGLAILLPL